MDELLPIPPVMQPPGSPSPASTTTDKDLGNLLAKGPNKKVLEPVLCHHCGRTASNGISCEGYCVADSNY